MIITILQAALGFFALLFGTFFFRDFLKNKDKVTKGKWPGLLGVGFVTNFFDTLGIGSFAPQTALFKFFHLVNDKFIPGTLNVGNTIPVILQAFIFISVVKVDPVTLVSMIVAAQAGAVIGAGIVSKLPVRKIQIGLGLALLAVAFTLFAGLMEWFPSGGTAVGLTGLSLIIAVAVSFILGSLHAIGIGFYAPCMALVYSLGMNPRAAFPIMMGSAAMLMPAAGMKFIKEKAHDRKASLALTALGVVGVILAAYIVTTLPLELLKWVVLCVLLYTSWVMFRSARQKVNQDRGSASV